MLVGPCGSQLHLDPTATLHLMGREVTRCSGCPKQAGARLRSPQEQEFSLSHLPELFPGHGCHVVGGSFHRDHLGGCRCSVVLASVNETRDQMGKLSQEGQKVGRRKGPSWGLRRITHFRACRTVETAQSQKFKLQNWRTAGWGGALDKQASSPPSCRGSHLTRVSFHSAPRF